MDVSPASLDSKGRRYPQNDPVFLLEKNYIFSVIWRAT